MNTKILNKGLFNYLDRDEVVKSFVFGEKIQVKDNLYNEWEDSHFDGVIDSNDRPFGTIFNYRLYVKGESHAIDYFSFIRKSLN